MPIRYQIFLSVPGLRTRDVTAEQTPTLFRWANEGAMAELVPSFPCVTSPVQATFWTGQVANEHGVIANGFFHRDRHEVEFWVTRNDVVAGEQIWDVLLRCELHHDARADSRAGWHDETLVLLETGRFV